MIKYKRRCRFSTKKAHSHEKKYTILLLNSLLSCVELVERVPLPKKVGRLLHPLPHRFAPHCDSKWRQWPEPSMNGYDNPTKPFIPATTTRKIYGKKREKKAKKSIQIVRIEPYWSFFYFSHTLSPHVINSKPIQLYEGMLKTSASVLLCVYVCVFINGINALRSRPLPTLPPFAFSQPFVPFGYWPYWPYWRPLPTRMCTHYFRLRSEWPWRGNGRAMDLGRQRAVRCDCSKAWGSSARPSRMMGKNNERLMEVEENGAN